MIASSIRWPLVQGEKSNAQITNELLVPNESKPALWWYAGMGIGTLALIYGAWAFYMSLSQGLGTWGLNQ
jgi:hypothetical protein